MGIIVYLFSRNLVLNLFARLKYFRDFTTHFEKLYENYKVMPFVECVFVWVKLKSRYP
ncbi:protein of unknown function [Legionella pneumophila subsp. pneumophila]|nr:protein of unknown function [Legionella pneumophila subsp. pneumophila]